jgi:hypothetical protein
MDKIEKLVLIAFLSGGFAGIIIHSHAWKDQHTQYTAYQEQIKECESTLPRNENCTLVALPISKD